MAIRRAHLVLGVFITLGIVVHVTACFRPDSRRGGTSRISTDHLDVTAYVRTGAAGAFSLVLDIDPRERIRVYAPGSAEYHGVTVTAAPTPFLHFHPPAFSTPERLNLPPPYDEVSVYRTPFRVSIEASPGNSQDLQATKDVVVRGVLQYQACNDKVCFPPASVPLSWTIPVRPQINVN